MDTLEETAPLAARLQDGIIFLSDDRGTLLDALGIRHAKGHLMQGKDTAYPATLFVNRDGTVGYAYRAPRADELPRPGEVMTAVQTQSGTRDK